jgi:hypothetical protein
MQCTYPPNTLFDILYTSLGLQIQITTADSDTVLHHRYLLRRARTYFSLYFVPLPYKRDFKMKDLRLQADRTLCNTQRFGMSHV